MGGKNSAPKAPNFAKQYEQGINVYLKHLPEMLQNELAYRQQYDPQYIAQQQAWQSQFGPAMYAQQLAALKQLDPTGTALQQALGQKISTDLARGYVDPRQNALYSSLTSQVARDIKQGGLSPQQAAAYRALGAGTMAQYGLGTQQDPAALRQEQQSIRAAQSARGNVYGNAPISAEALYLGQRGQQLQQQRTANLQNFLGLQNPAGQAL